MAPLFRLRLDVVAVTTIAWTSAATTFAQSVGPSGTLTAPVLKEERSDLGGPSYQLYLNSETRQLETTIPQRKILEGAQLFEVGVSGFYQPDPKLRLKFDLAAERMEERNVFLPRVASAELRPWVYTDVELGQFFVPVGFYVARDQWFANLPHYYARLLYWQRGTDAGAQVRLKPTGNDWVALEGALLSGRSNRPGDERPGPPVRTPQIITLRSRSDYHEVFLQNIEHHVAFNRRVQALGGGVSARYHWPELHLTPEAWLEAYQVRQSQGEGPREDTWAWSYVAQLRFHFVNVGIREAVSRTVVRSEALNQGLVPVQERTLFGDVYLHRAFRLRVERRQIGDRVALVDDWIGRAILELQVL